MTNSLKSFLIIVFFIFGMLLYILIYTPTTLPKIKEELKRENPSCSVEVYQNGVHIDTYYEKRCTRTGSYDSDGIYYKVVFK